MPGFLTIGGKILVIIQGNGNVMAIGMMKQLDNHTKDHKRRYVNHGGGQGCHVQSGTRVVKSIGTMRVPEESISFFTMGTLTGAAQDHEEEQAIELSI